MVEAIGALAIDFALDAAIEAGLSDAAIDAAVDFAAGSTLAVSNATLVGSGLLLAASIGLQFAMSRPSAPTAEDGTQPIRAALQPRQRGYWNNRLSGAVMLAGAGGAAPTTAYMICAFHQGSVDSLVGFYMDDDQVGMTPDISHGGQAAIGGPGGAYASANFGAVLGRQIAAEVLLTGNPLISAVWTSAFVGKGIAYWWMTATAPGDPTQFAKLFPRGLMRPSVVACCSPVWDPRDGTQDRNDPTTWKPSANPVLQLLDYLSAADGGMGFDIDEFAPPARLAQWMSEADLCDVDLGGGNIRYLSAGWYTFDTKPEDVINKILATCDGWLAPAGDGTLALFVGVYRDSGLPPITEDMIFDCQVSLGNPDETLVNQLDVSFTNPATDYSTDQTISVRDEVSISVVGEVKRQPLDLSWVQWIPQAGRLAERALFGRANPKRTGTLICKPIVLRCMGERWMRLKFPFPGIEDCVIEVQGFEADILGGQVTIKFITVSPATLANY